MGRLLRLLLTAVLGLGVVTGGLFAAGVIGPPSAGAGDSRIAPAADATSLP